MKSPKNWTMIVHSNTWLTFLKTWYQMKTMSFSEKETLHAFWHLQTLTGNVKKLAPRLSTSEETRASSLNICFFPAALTETKYTVCIEVSTRRAWCSALLHMSFRSAGLWDEKTNARFCEGMSSSLQEVQPLCAGCSPSRHHKSSACLAHVFKLLVQINIRTVTGGSRRERKIRKLTSILISLRHLCFYWMHSGKKCKLQKFLVLIHRS